MICRVLALALALGLAGCAAPSTTSTTDVAAWAGAFTCGFTDTVLAVAFPDMRFTAPGFTGTMLGLPLSYGGDSAQAFADACWSERGCRAGRVPRRVRSAGASRPAVARRSGRHDQYLPSASCFRSRSLSLAGLFLAHAAATRSHAR